MDSTAMETSGTIFSAGDVIGLKIGDEGQLVESGETVSSTSYRAVVPETTLLWLSRDEYVRIACPDNANMRSVEESGEVVAVTQYRAVRNKQYSQVVVRGMPQKLLEMLFMEEGGAMYGEDILLTYRTFGAKPLEVLSYLSEKLSQFPAQAQSILTTWITQYVTDFNDTEMGNMLASMLEQLLADDSASSGLLAAVRTQMAALTKDQEQLAKVLASHTTLIAPDLQISPSPQALNPDQLDTLSMMSFDNSSPVGSRRGSVAESANSSDMDSAFGSSTNLDKAGLDDGRKRGGSEDSNELGGLGRKRGGSVFRRKKSHGRRPTQNMLMPVKIYRADGTSRILACPPEDNATKLIQQAITAFCIDQPAEIFSLVCVTATKPDTIKQMAMPAQVTNLAKAQRLDGRFYLKPATISGHVASDEMMEEIMEQGENTILTVELKELVRALALQDFELFHSVQPIEYISDLFEIESPLSESHLQKLEDVSNWQMFWVASEVCREPDIVIRAQIIKTFIQLAVLCRRCRNYNTMCAVISGLSYAAVSRLKQTWERVPRKSVTTFEDMQQLLDPSRNMSNYRRMLTDEAHQLPILPFIPIMKKDLAFIHLGNKSKIDGLVNVDKLRMVASEVRKLSQYCSVRYDSDNMLTGLRPTGSEYVSSTTDSNALKKAHAALLSKMRISHYLENLEIIRDESQLSVMSREVESGDRCDTPGAGDGGQSLVKQKANVVRNTSLRMAKALKSMANRR